AGAYSAVARTLRQAGQSSKGTPQNIAGDAGGDGWHDAFPCQFLHEQIQETGLYSIQRRDPNRQFPIERRPARVRSDCRGTNLVINYMESNELHERPSSI